MQKKKVNLFSILIYIVLACFLGFMIYYLVGFNSSGYRSVSTELGYNYICNKTDNYLVYDASSVKNGDNLQVYLTLNEKDNKDNQVKVAFSTTYDSFYTINDGNGRTLQEEIALDFKENESNGYYKDLKESPVTRGYLVTSSVYQENWLITWLPTIISTVVTIAIAFLFFKVLMNSAGGNSKAFDFNKSTARRVDDSKVKFDDVAGCDEEKAELVEVVDYLKDPKKFTKYGAKLPKGILLVGHPGTGKTLLAKAVAGEAGVPFYSISGSDFVEMFVGVGAGRVRDLFKTAKQNAPCLIFIDEIDAVGRQRGAGLGGGNDEREQTLNQLLVELDGFEENSGIIVMAATNRDDVLDPALLRAGRFDRKITVSLPDKKGREAIFKVHAKNKKLDPSIDFEMIAKRTVGFSGADIANILNEAAILAIRNKRENITIADIDEAIDRRIAGPAKSSRGITEQERIRIAYHESGHAIIGIVLPNADVVRKITIIPRGNTGGHVLMGPEEDRFLLTKKELEAEICGLLGGRVSEELFFDDVSTGASNDIERATRIARSMVVEYGMSDLGPIQYEQASGNVFLGRDYNNTTKNFSVSVADQIDKEVRKIIDEAHDLAVKIITERKADVELIAKTLLDKETITEEEISYLLENRTLKKEETVTSNATTQENKEENKDTSIVDANESSKEEIKEPSIEDVVESSKEENKEASKEENNSSNEENK